jgi:hypothetical protein
MAENSEDEPIHSAARSMLDCFASVGASHFDVTLTTHSGQKDWFRREMPLADLRRAMPGMLDATAKRELNVIVRPTAQTAPSFSSMISRLISSSHLPPPCFSRSRHHRAIFRRG